MTVNARDKYIGKKFLTNEGYEIEIIEYKNAQEVTVRFENGYTVTRNTRNIEKGNIKNPYHPSICGKGYLGTGQYEGQINKKKTDAYSVWHGMIRRCYVERKELTTAYEDCEVCEEWLNFQNFAKWYYENIYKVDDEPMNLDKDVLIKGNKIYSPKTCIFLPKKLNTLFAKRQGSRGDLPIGVTHDKKCKSKPYRAMCNENGKRTTIGYYETPEEAFLAYKEFKEKHIKEVIETYKGKIPIKIYNALINYKIEITD